MTDRIEIIKAWQWDRKHHVFRKENAADPAVYQKEGMPDFERTAKRLCVALEQETPVFAPGELIAFTRTIPNLPQIYTDAEWKAITDTHFIHERGNVTNLSPDYEKVLSLGLNGCLKQLGEGPWDQAVRASIEAVLALTEKYRAAALEMGDGELAAVLSRVPAETPRSFREALQMLRIVHYAFWVEGEYHNTLGRFDQYMYPYLKKDLDEGRLTYDAAFELLEAFFLSCNRDSDWYIGMQQGDNGQSIVLGGMTKDGKNGYNMLSEMCLKASGELRLIDPKINLRVNKDTPLSVYEEGTKLTKLGLGFPQYENDDVAIPGLERLGYATEDARNYAMAACWEFIIPGRGMEIPNIGALPFANLTDSLIREDLKNLSDMDVVLALLEKKIYASVRETVSKLKNLYVIPSPFFSLFFDGCVENHRDISFGGVYNNFGLHGTGLAPAADMLAAVEQVIFTEHLPVDTLLAALKADFAGYEELHHKLKFECPKMGNNDDRVDKYAVRLLDIFSHAVEGLKNERGGIIRAGTGSAMFYIFHANELGATADGREKGVPLPANYAPSLNIRLNGPVSLISSFAKPDLMRTMNGGPLTIELSDTVFRSDESITKVAQLVRLFVLEGGHQMQLNTVNREQLLDAQKHPEKYRNLIVRVWGWSGYFVELDKCYQDHIISRVELQV